MAGHLRVVVPHQVILTVGGDYQGRGRGIYNTYSITYPTPK